MKQNVKEIYEKMIDYKQYAVVLLAFGAFLYLGLIIPSVEKSEIGLYVIAAASILSLIGSIFFFSRSKLYRNKLAETDEGQDYLMK
ncbi:YrhC family protein [Bacillus aquiflavi]|uniref:YrhC family protein n=1 Tax=Bacillus aquiflavi TaxID=2672567 RepID=A0A6B3W4P3_9BACI|nr:YrhC family protein [Bacillus aquiflavi]MBA4538543.1 YrhC family protein [Bacillus aquiflavi]NEY82906.1 hypothetical protein [Bacillus aquiflavi]